MVRFRKTSKVKKEKDEKREAEPADQNTRCDVADIDAHDVSIFSPLHHFNLSVFSMAMMKLLLMFLVFPELMTHCKSLMTLNDFYTVLIFGKINL